MKTPNNGRSTFASTLKAALADDQDRRGAVTYDVPYDRPVSNVGELCELNAAHLLKLLNAVTLCLAVSDMGGSVEESTMNGKSPLDWLREQSEALDARVS